MRPSLKPYGELGRRIYTSEWMPAPNASCSRIAACKKSCGSMLR